MKKFMAIVCALAMMVTLAACTRHSDATSATEAGNTTTGDINGTTGTIGTTGTTGAMNTTEPNESSINTTAPETGDQTEETFTPVGLWVSPEDSDLWYILAPGGIGYYDYGEECTWELVDDVLSIYDEDGTEVYHVIVSENETIGWNLVQELRGVEVYENFDPSGVWVDDYGEEMIFYTREDEENEDVNYTMCGSGENKAWQEIFYWYMEGCVINLEYKGDGPYPYVVLGDYMVSIYGHVLTRVQ